MKRIFVFMAVLMAAFALSGCVTSTPMKPAIKAAATTQSIPVKGIEEVNTALTCIAQSGVYQNLRVGVASWVDGTGKSNLAAGGGPNGSFLPQATTASFATQALRMAGAQAMDYYSVTAESHLRQMGTNHLQTSLASLTAANEPHFTLQGSWLTLDFEEQARIDAQIGGIGPLVNLNGAQVSLAIELVKPGSRKIIAQSVLERKMYSSSVGLSFGRVIGTTLVTGEAVISSQQALQLESASYMVGLGVAQVLTQNPDVPATCRAQVAKLLGEASPAI